MEDSPVVIGLKWFATGTGIVAALMIAWDHGRRTTGLGFVIFVASSIAWILGAVLAGDGALGTQNAVLLCINVFGVYRYLIRRKDV
ncbi:hypothetical protein M9980_05805 [Sphingomonas donggukensis]|uniref:PRC-barrel protein n=1 Tax=Sphingomonas donggukensis TaxID=2949093 RepID=A0ABY4TWE5_9SPHN|nr:hypothetical protein [Sphingomonas donggukensis]URW76718.1 hypothetical protein M9980_05805 [Sphingomonas donggukensis]